MGNRNPDNLSENQLSLVTQICQHNIGVWPGTGQFEACVNSLSDSLKVTEVTREKAIARVDCIRQGDIADTPALALCVLKNTDVNSTNPPRRLESEERVNIVNVTPYRPFSMDSLSEIRRREKLSCAELGFDPTTGTFDACVAHLEDELIAADRPYDGDMRSPGDSPFGPAAW